MDSNANGHEVRPSVHPSPSSVRLSSVRLCQPPISGCGRDIGGNAPKKLGKSKLGCKKSALWVHLFQCSLCRKQGRSPPLRRCTKCEVAYYCGKACQRAHWKSHKPACIAAVAAKAEDARREVARAVHTEPLHPRPCGKSAPTSAAAGAKITAKNGDFVRFFEKNAKIGSNCSKTVQKYPLSPPPSEAVNN